MKNFQLHFVTNKTTARWLQMLNTLEKSTVCSATELAEISHSTSRTIGKDIHLIRDYFRDAILLKSTHHGYVFTPLSLTVYEEKKASLLSNEPLFIILESIFFSELLPLDEWAERLYLSKKTLAKYISNLQDQLNHFDLTLSLDPVNIIGNEADIRKFFCTLFYESDITPHTVFPSLAAQQAVNEMSSLFENESYQNTSFSLYTYLLYITLERFIQGNTVEINEELHHALRHSVQLFHFQQINIVIDKYYDFKLSENELIFLFVSIITQRKLSNITIEQKFCLSYNHWSRIGALTTDFAQLLALSPQHDKRDLIFLESFFTTAKLKECMSVSANRNTEDINIFIQQIFPDEFLHYYEFLAQNAHYLAIFSKTYLTDFCSNLVIYIETIRLRYWKQTQHIAFIFEGNNNITQFIEALSYKYFSGHHQLFYPDSGEVNRSYLIDNQIDLLITNYPEHMSEFREVTDCLLFKTIPDAADWNRLIKQLNPKIMNQYQIVDKAHTDYYQQTE
ncbi:hypothetical protein A5886_000965 [Enterococcus sp. 8G7_MSG3316]|uniref:Mga helix-turn-helix domain-containing protein n=1 Tax=Candidatus Enterococcus testudinis TaxID=1834191 RepID=A0A242A4P6_9ENTE|nr:helix-turn-helix domain-containing protein [Enterococcus sp. 8G7_MSG3316]OTN75889.1 hypothetical protein A5886_000965 [Enterococcus sp. 8G7_MSG3316]